MVFSFFVFVDVFVCFFETNKQFEIMLESVTSANNPRWGEKRKGGQKSRE